jgi:hypothetical protein
MRPSTAIVSSCLAAALLIASEAAATAQNGYTLEAYRNDQRLTAVCDVDSLSDKAEKILEDFPNEYPTFTFVAPRGGFGCDLAFPFVPDKNYLGEWVRHRVATLAMRKAILQYVQTLAAANPALQGYTPPSLAAFNDLIDLQTQQFQVDQNAFQSNLEPNLAGINSFTAQNKQIFTACIHESTQAAGLPFLGFRKRPPVGARRGGEHAKGGLGTALNDVQARPIKFVSGPGIQRIDIVTELERWIHELDPRTANRNGWHWTTIVVDQTTGVATAQLVPEGVYFVRLNGDNNRCYSVRVDNNRVIVPK